MKQLQVKTSTNDYCIVIDENIRFRILDYLDKDYSSIFVITDETVASLYLDDVLNSLQSKGIHTNHYIIPSGEASKGIDMYYTLQTNLVNAHLDRHSLIIAFGGGVVGDLAGFVAATYMRGIDYVQLPTTILAHDSSVGGKVAINHELGKNMIGSFYPPVAVLFDVSTLQTLAESEKRSGYAELIKEACIANPPFLDELLSVSLDTLTLEQIKTHLYQGIQVKRDVVEKDEKEANIRMYLNFGHTLAHALETELGYGVITHGEAVAIGMLFALRKSKHSTPSSLPYDSIYEWLKQNHYPLNLYDLDINRLISHMKNDKKTTKQHIQMVLLESVGTPTIQSVSDEELYYDLQEFKEELHTK